MEKEPSESKKAQTEDESKGQKASAKVRDTQKGRESEEAGKGQETDRRSPEKRNNVNTDKINADKINTNKKNTDKRNANADKRNTDKRNADKRNTDKKNKGKKYRAANRREIFLTGGFFAALFMVMIGYLGYFTATSEQEMINNSYNSRQEILLSRNYRGAILDRNGEVLAETLVDEEQNETREIGRAHV